MRRFLPFALFASSCVSGSESAIFKFRLPDGQTAYGDCRLLGEGKRLTDAFVASMDPSRYPFYATTDQRTKMTAEERAKIDEIKTKISPEQKALIERSEARMTLEKRLKHMSDFHKTPPSFIGAIAKACPAGP